MLKTPIFLIALWLLLVPSFAAATTEPGEVPNKVGVDEHLGEFVDLGLTFTAPDGSVKTLKDFIKPNRPAIIMPVYYNCPSLCSSILNGAVDVVNELKLNLGTDFTIINISINTKETHTLAAAKFKSYLKTIDDKQAASAGWYFLTGDEQNVSSIMKQIGFRYQPDGAEFMHTAMYAVVSPDGKITRYLYGIKHEPQTLELALVESSKGMIGETLHKVLLYCFRFDPTKGIYTLSIMKITNIICIAFVILVVFYVSVVHLREKRRRRAEGLDK